MQLLLTQALVLIAAASFTVQPKTDQQTKKTGSKDKRAAHVIRVLDVRKGQVIADIGCGDGWLSAAVAKAVGADGTVFAVDIGESSIRKVRERGVANIKPVLSKRNDVSLPEDTLDTAFLHDVADHVQRSARPKFYASIARALKADGRLYIFDPHGGAKRHLDELRNYGFVAETDEDLTEFSKKELKELLQEGIRFRYVGVRDDAP